LVKYFSAKTGKTTYVSKSTPRQPSRTPSSVGTTPMLPTGWSTSKPTEPAKKEFTRETKAPGHGGGTSVDPRYESSSITKTITKSAGKAIQQTAQQTEQKKYETKTVSFDKPAYKRESTVEKTIKQYPTPTNNFKNIISSTATQILSKEKIKQTLGEVQTKTKDPVFLSGLMFGGGIVTKGAAVAKAALPIIKGTGTGIFERLVGGVGKRSIYAEKPLITEAGTKIVKLAGGVGKKSIYAGEKIVEQETKQTGKGVIKGSAKWLAEHPKTRSGLMFAQGMVAPDVFAATAEATKKDIKITKTEKIKYEKATQTAFGEAEYLSEFKEGKTPEGKTEYKPTVPGVTVPVLGYLSVMDLVPAKQVMPVFGIGEKYGKDFKTVMIRELKKEGISEKRATELAEHADITQRQARGYGGAYGLLSIGIGEEALAQSLFKKGITESGKVTAKALTKKEASKLVGQKITSPLLMTGAVGGASSVIAEQRMQQQELNPVTIGLGALMGSASAYALGKPIATKAITSPTQSKALYGLGSILDPFEAPADILEGRIARRLGQKELRIKIRTPSITPSTATGPPSVLPTTTKKTSYVLTPTKTKPPSVTPVPSELITPSSSVTPVPSELITPSSSVTPVPSELITPSAKSVTELPSYIATPVEEVTETPAATTTATTTPTPTQTVSSVFIPTFTAPFVPFLPPLLGGGEVKGKQKKRERTRFIDEFSAAFGGLATPGTPVYFGKQKPITLARKQAKQKKRGDKFGPNALENFYI